MNSSTLRRAKGSPLARLAAASLMILALPVASSAFAPAGAQAAEPTIQFLNPHPDTGAEVSDQEDTRGTNFHLVAVVGNAPIDPGVEFHVAPEDEPGFTLPPATRVGTSDTWELNWSIPQSLADGDYVFTALLYSNASNPPEAEQVAQDQVTAYINQHEADTDVLNGSPEEPAAETVEIVYPSNAGQFGMHAAAGQAGVGVVEVVFSTGTTYINLFYTVSPPGTEPDWKPCNSGAPRVGTGSTNGPALLRCTLAKTDSLLNVTGVAAQANDTPQPPGLIVGQRAEFNDSSDAHRVFPYFQTPTFMTFEPNSVRASNIANCSPMLKTRVFDQNGRAIAGANVDVHAKGPSDQLAFDTDVNPSDANQPPDKSHGKEVAWNCSFADFGGQQGDHNVPVQPDIKHIETVAAGTNNDGGFSFRMHTDSPGETQITAWADMDDDDEYCVSEVNWSAAIGWGGSADTPPPVFTGVPPDEQICGGRTLTLSPNEVTNRPGTQQTFVASVRDGNGQPVVGAPVEWDVSGVGAITSAEAITDENGQARATVTSPAPGNQRVTASTDCDNNADPGDCVDRSVAHWGPGFCDIFGDNSDDTLEGTKGDDTICAFGGDDEVVAGRGDDLVLGGRGDDNVNGGSGNDRLVGGSGNDALKGGSGADELLGKGGADNLVGGAGRDRCRSGPGNDSVRGCEE